MMNNNIQEFTFVVKDKNGFYFCGYNKWDNQIRKAKMYHSNKYAKEIVERFSEREPFLVRVIIMELRECN